jgi:serine/threonine protein phosphatase PrpC
VSLGRSAGRSDTGRKRRHNEDAYVMHPPVFAVADGMGGAQAGELASRLAAETVEDEQADAAGVQRVTSLVQAANRRVYERSREDTAFSGMGTTMTVALVEDGVVTIGHVGDSRAYMIRDGSLEQLTHDHSLVAELVRSGKLTPEEAEHHPQRSVITRALGTDPDVDVDTYSVDARAGDVFLLCSDGLTSMVGDAAILRIVEHHRDDLDAAARELIATANRGGGEDNITVVFFDIAPEGETVSEAATVADAPALAGPDPADEDTLSELDHVPAVSTMVVPAEQIQAALAETEAGGGGLVSGTTAPPAPPRRRRLVAGALVVLAVLVAAALVLWLSAR